MWLAGDSGKRLRRASNQNGSELDSRGRGRRLKLRFRRLNQLEGEPKC